MTRWLCCLALTAFAACTKTPREEVATKPVQRVPPTTQEAPPVTAPSPVDTPRAAAEPPAKPAEGTPASEGLPLPSWPAWADNDQLSEEQLKKVNAMAVTRHAAIDFDILPFDSEKPVRLSAHFGKPLVVVFWATWCDSCAEEFLVLKKVYEQHHDRVNFLGISLDHEDDPPGFVKKAGLPWPNAFDTGAVSKLAVVQTPRLLFINSDGRLVVDFDGAMTPKALDAAIKKLK